MGEQLDLLLRSVAPNEAQMERLRRDFPGAFVEGALDPGGCSSCWGWRTWIRRPPDSD